MKAERLVTCDYCGKARERNDKPCSHCGAPLDLKPRKQTSGGFWKEPVSYIMAA